MLILCGIGCQLAQLIVSIRNRESLRDTTGDPWDGRTLEWVELPDDIVARIEGKSSLGRLGLIVHATAGFCDPGWRGTLTLELNNLTRVPIVLHPGLPIAQLSFMTLDRAARRPYGSEGRGSHYLGQRAATASRYRPAPDAA